MFEAISLKSADVKGEEEALRIAIRNLPDSVRQIFYHRYNAALKDPDTYAVLNWLLLAGLRLHHFYLGKNLRGSLNLLVMLIGAGMLFFSYSVIGGTMIVAILLVELPALFRSQTIVMDYNNRLAIRLMQDLRQGRP